MRELNRVTRRRAAAIVAAGVLAVSTAVIAPADASGPVPSPKVQLPDRPAPRDTEVEPYAPVAPKTDVAAVERADEAALARVVDKPVTWPAAGVSILSATSKAAMAREVSVAAAKAVGVRLQVHDQTASARAGINGVLLSAQRADRSKTAATVDLSVDYRGFGHAFGADWAERLRVVAMPACVLTTPDVPACLQATPLRSSNDVRNGSVSAEFAVSSQPRVLAVTAGPESSTGDYAATSLSPSSSWSAGGSSGDFTWSYPLRMPPATGGPAPDLSFQYSAQSVDGRTAASNNQSSWVGEGFELSSSYVERRFASCDVDGHAGKFDLCWRYDNALLVLNGKANELVKSGTTWRLREDDGSKVEKLAGAWNGDVNNEHWKVTTPDGTQYYFGLYQLPGYDPAANAQSVYTVPVAGDDPGEPCYNSAGFASSFCSMAWRWNLDYVLDTDGNAMTMWYTKEYNNYAKNGVASPGTKYVRGGYLNKIEYGQRESTLAISPAPQRVQFTTAERCLANCSDLNSTTKANWPDVPFDQVCNDGAACTGKLAPTFFSRRRLYQITTEVLKGTTYQPVDFWQTSLGFPSPNDGSTGAAMWLYSITHKGKVGTEIALPAVSFGRTALPNRVDSNSDGLNSLTKFRVGTISSETGALVTVDYAPDQCSPTTKPAAADSNTMRCFPVKWTPQNNPERTDWFHKHVVSAVRTNDVTSGGQTMVTSYSYSGAPAWHYQETALVKEADKTWSDWRGYQSVTTSIGDPANPGPRSRSVSTYFRGMNGDRTSSGGTKTANVIDSQGDSRVDQAALRGREREQITYAGAGSTEEVSGVRTDYWVYEKAAQTVPWGTLRANFINPSSRITRTHRDGGRADLIRTTATEYDTDNGLPVRVTDYGDSTKTDETCTVTSYAKNTSAWLISYPSRVVTSKGVCDSGSANPVESRALSDVRTLYDGGGSGAAPTKGSVTAAQRLSSYDAGVPQYQTVATNTYDALGRITSAKDALNRTTTTAYTPAGAGPLTKTVVTTPAVTVADGTTKGFATTTTIAPEWGSTTQVADPNGKITDLSYDALGRLTSVWLPNQSKAAGKIANTKYTYSVSNTVPSSVRTDSLNTTANGYLMSYAIFDSLLRPRQTQQPGANGGRVIATTLYNSWGQVSEVDADLYNSSAPSGTLLGYQSGSVPAMTTNNYDGAGRPNFSKFTAFGTDRWGTFTDYGGDTVTVRPPNGGSATTTTTDVFGQTVQRREYDGNTTTGSSDLTSYTYDLAGRMTQLSGAGGTWTYGFDLRGRQITSTDPDAGTTTSTYDAADRLVSTTDSESHTLIHGYDALDRKTTLHKGAVSDATLLAAWTYDQPGLYGQQYSATRYTAGKTGPMYRSVVLSRNVVYKPKQVTLTIPAGEEPELAGTYETIYGYQPDESTLSFTSMPGGGGLGQENVSMSYSPVGLPIGMQSTDRIYIGDIDYTPLGDVDAYRLGGNGDMTVANIYEEGTRRLQRSTALSYETFVSDHTYTYDAIGNVTRDHNQNTLLRDTQCFQYDGHRRLTEAWTPASTDCTTAPSVSGLGGINNNPYWQSWTYTAAGLRKTQVDHAATSSTSTYTYDTAQPHTLVKVATTGTPDKNYTYDDKGNTITRPGTSGTQTLSWDDEGRLSKLAEPTIGDTDYIYDADGTLLLRRGQQETTLFAGDLEITMNNATRARQAIRRYTLDGYTFATKKSTGTGTADMNWLVNDQHNTSEISVGTTDRAVERRFTTPFGAARGTPSVDWPDQHGFLGKPHDKTTGLTHVGAREYDPTTGRFISVDPLMNTADPQSLLAYAYAGNNPTSMSDPTGLMNDSLTSGGTGWVPDEEIDNEVPDGADTGSGSSTSSSNEGSSETTGGRSDRGNVVRYFGKRNVVAPNAVVYFRAYDAAKRKMSQRGPMYATSCSAMNVRVSTGNGSHSCGLSDTMFARAFADEMCAQADMLCNAPDTLDAPIVSAIAIIGLGKDGSSGSGRIQPPGKGPGERIEKPIWSAKPGKTPVANAYKHFKDHGGDFPDVRNAVDYVATAQKFLRDPPPGTMSKTRPHNGDVVRWNPTTNEFGVMNSSGAPRTYFQPDPAVHKQSTNADYFNAQ